MAISKVYLNSDVQMDVTDTTASQSDVASTKYYYGADGVKKQGSYVVPSAVTQATPTISVNTSTGLITASATQSAGVVSAGTKSATEQLSTEAGKTVTPTTSEQTAVAANKYTLGAIKVAAMPAGSAATPATSITANPSISVSSGGLITATASATKSVTPTVSAGYVSSGTAGTITVSGSNTEQLTTQAAQTIYPSTSDQTIASGKYLTGTQTFAGVLLTNLSAGNIKKDVVVKIGDSADDDRITSVTGTYEGSGGGGVTPADPKDVNFIDYDGTIVYSYTKAEFANLSALPANPSHDGLTAQGWNWTKQEITTQLTAMPDQKVWVGQMYKTASGKTEIDIELGNAELLTPYLKISVNGTVEVDWGDGSAKDTVTGTSLSTETYTPHTYATTGSYTISIEVKSGSFTFYNNYILSRANSTSNASRRYNSSIVAVRFGDGVTSIGAYAFDYCYALQSVTIPSGVTLIGAQAFHYCSSLQSVTIPSEVTSIGANAFYACYALQSVTIPSGVTSIGANAFYNCYSLQNVVILGGVTSIGDSAFRYCYSLQNVAIPSGVTSIGASTFNSCYSLYSITFRPTTAPTVANSNAWSSVPTDCTIYIPYSALASYLSASNYPAKTTYTYIGYATYNSGVTLPTQDSTAAYNVTWYASKADAKAQTNAITQGNGSEIYCRYTAV